MKIAPERKPLLFAHRGIHRDFPENSIEAFRRAFELGADGIEFDVHLTKDGKIVVLHHSILDHREGSPVVEMMHSRELSEYPTLDQVLQEFGQLGRMEIEIKTPHTAILQPLAELLAVHNVRDVELTSSIVPLALHMSKHFPNALVGLIFKNWLFEPFMTPEYISYWVTQHLQLTGATTVHIDLNRYTQKLVDDIRAMGVLVHGHLFTAERESWEKAVELGIDQSTFDDPAVLNFR